MFPTVPIPVEEPAKISGRASTWAQVKPSWNFYHTERFVYPNTLNAGTETSSRWSRASPRVCIEIGRMGANND